jgi:hypothetical protein
LKAIPGKGEMAVRDIPNGSNKGANRRSFLRKSVATGATTIGGAFLSGGVTFADDENGREEGGGRLTKGDAALLRFAAAVEILETDFWTQYNELGGIQDSEVSGGSGNSIYTTALSVLDSDMAQYIHDNTEDEISHYKFLNAYLASKGAEPVDLEPFRTLPGSTASGSSGSLRLTNLMQLTLDTSWWTRYRSSANNPDLDPTFVFPQAIPGLSTGQFPAIPRSDADLTPALHIQAIANTAGFHMPTIEQGGNSLYPAMAQRATSVEVLRILISIGPTETMHFQTWQDKAGNAPPLTDPTNGLVFPDLNAPPFDTEEFTTNLIMPEPCPFLSRNLPVCSVIRPTETKGIAKSVANFFTAMGLFVGQSPAFFELLGELAEEADQAKRGTL